MRSSCIDISVHLLDVLVVFGSQIEIGSKQVDVPIYNAV